jgi:transglutaminase-like putative cysteine protease
LPEQVLVSAMAAAAVMGFATAQGAPLALAAIAVFLLSLFWRPARVPRWFARIAPSGLRIALAAVFFMRAGLTIYPLLDDERVAAVALFSGSILVPLLALAVLGTRIWSPAMGAVPLSIAVLAVASFDANPRVRWAQIVGALLGLAYLRVVLHRLEPATASRPGPRRWIGLALFASVAAVMALLLIRFLPWAQPHVEDAAATLLNPSFPVAQAGFSANSKLGDIERLALSRTVVLRVWTPAPRKLRARVLTEFDGRTWHAPRPGWADLPIASTRPMPEDLSGWLAALPGTSFGDGAAASGPEQTRMRVAQAVMVADTLFAPVGVSVAHVRGTRLRANRFGIFEAPGDPVGMYALVHSPVAASAAGEAGGETLAVDDAIDPRLIALAGTLAAGDPAPPLKIARTVHHLARECRYSLDVGAFRSAQPVAEFLFEKKRGYCEYFATAAALLLRLQGVPTRYVTGFSMDAAEPVGGHYVVRESDAHAWIEAWVPERGWIEVDPTPAADYAAVHAERGSLIARVGEWLKARWAEAALAVRTGELRGLSFALSLLLATVIASVAAVLGLRRWRRGARPAPAAAAPAWNGDPDLARVMARLDAAWARHGHARPAHRGPLEHLRRAPPGRLPASLQAASAEVIACYYHSRYGGVAPAPETVRGLARLLEDHPS